MKKLYNLSVVENLIEGLMEKGYECIQLEEGCLGIGYWVCVAPSENYYNFIVQEVPLNCWSSAHTITRKGRLSKEIQKRLDAIAF